MAEIINTYTEKAMLQGEDVMINAETYLVDAVGSNQKNQAVKLMKQGLKNPHFQVKLHTKGIKQALKEGYYPELGLFEHDLVIPKGTVTYTKIREVKKAFGAEQVEKRPSEYVMKVYLNEGPYAVTIDTTVDELNEGIGAFAEKLLLELNIEDYRLIFNIKSLLPC